MSLPLRHENNQVHQLNGLSLLSEHAITCSVQHNRLDKHKRIYTTNPPKPKEVLTDSIVVAYSVSVSTTIDNDGNGQTIGSSFDNKDLMSLVALPLKKIHINSGFGMRKHPVYHRKMMHNGIDLSARYEKVYSIFPGTVIKVGQDSRSGKFVTVRTGNYTISYCHLSQQLVTENEFVNAGTNIAISGNTGASTGPHLSQVLINGVIQS